MNQQERDSLREKHRVGQNEADNQCQSCYSPDGYPCDTIKVLDALDEVLVQVNAPIEVDQHECDHTDDTGLCWCESGFKRCPECHEWFGIDHARKDIEADIAVMWPEPIATSVVEECECGEEL